MTSETTSTDAENNTPLPVASVCSHRWIVNTGCGTEHCETREQAVEFMNAAIDDARRDAMGSGEWQEEFGDWYIAEIRSIVAPEPMDDDGVDYVIEDVV